VTDITDQLAEIERRINFALERGDRVGERIKIVAVSKHQPAAAVARAAAAGLTDFGENYLQEGIEKIEAVASAALCWHFIGQIQSNKTRPIAEHFSWVETLDRARIADRLNAQRPVALPPLNVLIQLNLDAEPQKGGVARNEILPLARHIAELPHLNLRGVMGMPPAGLGPTENRASFLAIAAEAERLRAQGFAIDTISMGMSGDFELAIECGATTIRLGTVLFGQRPSAPA
jgi:pyridoxal phosphate enzyme (YggS family)